jgi:hypothetical protein
VLRSPHRSPEGTRNRLLLEARTRSSGALPTHGSHSKVSTT